MNTEMQNITSGGPSPRKIFWRSFILFLVPFTLVPVVTQLFSSFWYNWRTLLPSSAGMLGVFAVPGLIFSFVMFYFAEKKKRQGIVLIVILALLLVGINVFVYFYTKQNPEVEFMVILFGFFVSGVVIATSLLVAFIVRLTKRVSQKIFFGIGIGVVAFILITASVGFLYIKQTMQFAETTDDTTICDRITQTEPKQICYQNIARKRLDPSLCTATTFTGRRSVPCVVDILIETKDLAGCYTYFKGQSSNYEACVPKIFPLVSAPWEQGSTTDPAIWCRAIREYPQLLNTAVQSQAEQYCRPYPEVPTYQ